MLQNATLARLFSIDLFKGKHFIVYTDNKDTDILQLLGNMYSDLVQLKKTIYLWFTLLEGFRKSLKANAPHCVRSLLNVFCLAFRWAQQNPIGGMLG